MKILVAVDGSEISVRAANHANVLARSLAIGDDLPGRC